MTPEKIYELFGKTFPNIIPQVTKWFGRKRKDDQFEKGSIRIVLKNGKTLIFGVNSDDSWTLTR